MKVQQTQVTLVASVWEGQPWYSAYAVRFPWWIPLSNELFLTTFESVVMSFQPKLDIWPICRKFLLVRIFQTQLGISSWPLGELSLTRPMICASKMAMLVHFKGLRSNFWTHENFLAGLYREGYQLSSSDLLFFQCMTKWMM